MLEPGYWCGCWRHTGTSGRCGWHTAQVSWHHTKQHLPRNQHLVHCGEKLLPSKSNTTICRLHWKIFFLTAGDGFIHLRRHLKALWKYKRPLNPEDDANTSSQERWNLPPTSLYLQTCVCPFCVILYQIISFISELALSDISTAFSGVNEAVHFPRRKTRYIATTEGYNKPVQFSTCCYESGAYNYLLPQLKPETRKPEGKGRISCPFIS